MFRSKHSPPPDLPVEMIEVDGFHPWLVSGEPSRAVIVLLHGIQSDRLSMVERARFLHQAGYSVVLFDFAGHGERKRSRTTFGFRESRDVDTIVHYLRSRFPSRLIAAIGCSLGGAAAVMAHERFDALILEAVYPTIDQAVVNRLRVWLGSVGALGTPMVASGMERWIGAPCEALRPIERIAEIGCPVLLISGALDRCTTAQETSSLYERAASPKQMWLVPGAAHIDLYQFTGREYQDRVLQFLETHLPGK